MPTLSEVPNAGLLATRPCCTLRLLDEVDLTDVFLSRTGVVVVFVRLDAIEEIDFVDMVRPEAARLCEEVLLEAVALLATDGDRDVDVGVRWVGLVEVLTTDFSLRTERAVTPDRADDAVERAVGLAEGEVPRLRTEAAEGARGGLVGRGGGGAAAFSLAAAVARSRAREAAVERTDARAEAPSCETVRTRAESGAGRLFADTAVRVEVDDGGSALRRPDATADVRLTLLRTELSAVSMLLVLAEGCKSSALVSAVVSETADEWDVRGFLVLASEVAVDRVRTDEEIASVEGDALDP